MKPLKIVLTASGAPGCSTLIRKLRDNGERQLTIVGTDSSQECLGRFWSDRFYRVPPASSPDYLDALHAVVEKERPDLLFPVSSYEVPVVSGDVKRFEAVCPVLVSDHQAIQTASNKHAVWELLKEKTSAPVPGFHLVKSLDEFNRAVADLGHPGRNVCFKPPVSKGSRGFRILSDDVDRRDLLLNHKPQNVFMTLAEFNDIFKDDEDFPELLVMEVVTGPEYDVMTLCLEGEALLTTVKTREAHRWGIISLGELVDNPRLVELTREVIAAVGLSFNISVQFIGDTMIEINPRTSTYIYQSDLNEPYLAIKLKLGEISAGEVRAMQSKVKFGRRMLRYMDQVFWNPGENRAED